MATSALSTRSSWADVYARLGEAPPNTRIAVEALINRYLPQRSRQLARAKMLQLDPVYEELRQSCKFDLKRLSGGCAR